MDELTDLVGTALAVDYPGQVNGRVRAVPDRRAIRWYTTIGLIDRPAELRGRTAFYGHRHLLQLVAIKRLQSQGRTLADIQAELSGATDRTLRTIAALPAELSSADSRQAPEIPAAGSPVREHRQVHLPVPRPASTRARFWTERPVVVPDADEMALATAIRLATGVTIVLDPTGVQPSHLTAEQLSALRSAAAPLLAELARQHLTHHPAGHQRSTAQRESGDPT